MNGHSTKKTTRTKSLPKSKSVPAIKKDERKTVASLALLNRKELCNRVDKMMLNQKSWPVAPDLANQIGQFLRNFE